MAAYSREDHRLMVAVGIGAAFVVGLGAGAQLGDRQTTVKDGEVVIYNDLPQCAEDEVWLPAEYDPPIRASDLECVHIDVLAP